MAVVVITIGWVIPGVAVSSSPVAVAVSSPGDKVAVVVGTIGVVIKPVDVIVGVQRPSGLVRGVCVGGIAVWVAVSTCSGVLCPFKTGDSNSPVAVGGLPFDRQATNQTRMKVKENFNRNEFMGPSLLKPE
jgi:hypothetical protein